MAANLPKNEATRLQLLKEHKILDTEPEKAYDDITSLAANVCGTPIGAISFVDRRREWNKSSFGLSFKEIPRGISLFKNTLGVTPVEIHDVSKDMEFSSNPLVVSDPFIRFYAGVPLLANDEFVLGRLYVMDRVPRILNKLQMEILSSLGRQVMALLELRRQLVALEGYAIEHQRYQLQLEETNAKLELLSITDVLTGLGNRRALEEHLSYEIGRATRYRRSLSIMLIDIDYFKIYNDTFGHPEGDNLLKIISKLAHKETRKSDLVARYGGDEFAIILPNTRKSAAKILAERFRKGVEEISTLRGPVTVSVGIVSMEGGTSDSATLIAEADRALYQAKNLGRNQVCHVDDI